MKLFTLGPVEMFPFTKEINKQKIPYFRTEDFSSIMLESEYLLKKFVGTSTSSKAIFLTASGTAAMEATVINCFSNRSRLLVIDGGTFGHRFAKICDTYRIPYDSVKLLYGETLTAEKLALYEGVQYNAMLININETSTCQLYDIKLVSDFCKQKNMYLIVDAISSFLADEYCMDQYGIDATILSSQKGLALEPGMSFALLNERLYEERVANNKINTLYFDFDTYIENQRRGQPPYTPAVRIVLELYDMLKHLEQEGVAHRIKETFNIAEDFRNRVAKIGLEIPKFPLSNAGTPLLFSKSNAKYIYNYLVEKYGFFLTPCGGELKDISLRVAHIGYHTLNENNLLINAIESALDDFKRNTIC